ncbi:unnamed protein product [Soboliphyme baturini]|uniref:UNC93-like protein n=1 Tax=Soboliphyme baturini TaxID=241478 RepID=A0A183IMH2_9BILA|nr:unnamed protein product [Soboliphyme baturini]
MFSYGLTNMLLSAFLGSAMNHIGTVTLMLAGFASQLCCLFVMWMWKPVGDDQPILYVIVTSWSVGNSIWQIVVKMMLYESFQEQPDAPFVILYVGNAFGLSMGFLIKPFGTMEHKIYVVGLVLVIAVAMAIMQETNRQKMLVMSSRT